MVFFVLFLFPFIVSEYPGRLSIGEDRFWPIFFIYFLLVPNLGAIGIGGAGGIFQLGTIGTEEQFYWIWPFFIKFFKWIGAILIFIFLFISLLPHLVDYTRIHLANQDWQIKFLTQLGLFLPNFKINSMALGGMAAYVHFYKKEKILAFLFHPITQAVAVLFGFGGWILGFHLSYFTDEFYSFFFAIIILNLATNPKTIFHLNFSILEYLGKISYGIYTFHWVIILLVIYLLKPISFFQDLKIIPLNLILYPLITGLTLLVSHFSFFYFEKYFLNWKKTFSKISM
jgi:peptidoglycan/LPS O-acetylase OafA/YrhL